MEENQDAFSIAVDAQSAIIALCDGLGGHDCPKQTAQFVAQEVVKEMQNVGVHITVFECEVCFEIDIVSLDEDNYLSEDEAIFQLNNVINSWQEKGELA